jgi:hypothetical protein
MYCLCIFPTPPRPHIFGGIFFLICFREKFFGNFFLKLIFWKKKYVKTRSSEFQIIQLNCCNFYSNFF